MLTSQVNNFLKTCDVDFEGEVNSLASQVDIVGKLLEKARERLDLTSRMHDLQCLGGILGVEYRRAIEVELSQGRIIALSGLPSEGYFLAKNQRRQAGALFYVVKSDIKLIRSSLGSFSEDDLIKEVEWMESFLVFLIDRLGKSR